MLHNLYNMMSYCTRSILWAVFHFPIGIQLDSYCQLDSYWIPIGKRKSIGIQLESGNHAFSNFKFASLYQLVHDSTRWETYSNWKLEICWNPITNWKSVGIQLWIEILLESNWKLDWKAHIQLEIGFDLHLCIAYQKSLNTHHHAAMHAHILSVHCSRLSGGPFLKVLMMFLVHPTCTFFTLYVGPTVLEEATSSQTY